MTQHHTYFNGSIRLSSETQIGITDLGLLRGYGLFDYFRTYNGQPFMWDLYWKRFETSAQILGIPNPISKTNALQVVQDLLAKSGLADASFRFILTGGYSPDSISSTQPNLMISTENIPVVAAAQYENGIKVIAYDFVRDIPAVKSTDYKHLLLLQPNIKAAGASDVLFHKDNYISELSRSNVFIFKENVLITPNNDILNGITRQVVVELAKPFFKVEERPISMAELLAADEVFTTSSTKKILAVSQLDNHVFSKGAGKNTRFLMQAFDEKVRGWGG
jgi:branched-chain amino acid aminotransferase